MFDTLKNKIGYILPTYEEVERVLSKYTCFFKKEYNIEGHKLFLYGYHFIQNEPYTNQDDLVSYEMRSLVYDATDNKFYLGMSKMFEPNEIPENLYDYYITDKVDGSLIIPIVLNDKVYMRSRNKFFSEHSDYASFLINDRYKIMIKDLFANGYIPYFELVSKKYKIVLDYEEDNLFIIQIRNNNSGIYLDYEEIKNIAKYYNLPICEHFIMNKKEMIEKIKREKNIEGWVLVKRNNANYTDSFKVKTEWYKKMHYLNADTREHNIIKAFLTGDLLHDIENKPNIVEITSKIADYIDKTYKDIKDVLNTYSHYDRKTFYEKNKNHEYISIIMKFYGKEYSDYDIKKLIINETIRKTNSYVKAIEFLRKI